MGIAVVQLVFHICEATFPPLNVRLPVLVTVPLLYDEYSFDDMTRVPFTV